MRFFGLLRRNHVPFLILVLLQHVIVEILNLFGNASLAVLQLAFAALIALVEFPQGN